jgi:hypothetical protein
MSFDEDGNTTRVKSTKRRKMEEDLENKEKNDRDII